MPITRHLLAGLAAAALIAGAGMSSSAEATPSITYGIHGTLDDGGTASGYFHVDQYGFLSGPWNMVTTPGTTIGTGFDYNNSDSYYYMNAAAGLLEFYNTTAPAYSRFLNLVFNGPLDAGAPVQLINASSYECAAYTCPGPTGAGGNTRYFISSNTTIPEPPGAILLGVGLFALGIATRRRG